MTLHRSTCIPAPEFSHRETKEPVPPQGTLERLLLRTEQTGWSVVYVFSTLSHSRIRIYDHFSLDIAGPQLYTEAQSIEGVASAMRYIEDPRQERLFDPYQGLFPPLARRILEN